MELKIIKKNSLEAYKKRKKYKEQKNIEAMESGNCTDWVMEYFYKGNVKELIKVMEELDVYEKAFLFSIAPYIGYEDCRIKYLNGNDLTFDKLVEISGMSRSKLAEIIYKLIHKDILYKGKNSKNTQYFVNPWLFCKGDRISKVLEGMFRNYQVRVLGKKWKEL